MTRTLDDVDWPVRTDRLAIRRGTEDDVEATWEFRRLPEVHAWLTSGTTDPEAYRARFLNPGRLAHLLVLERDGAVVGDLMLRVTDAWAQTEVAEQAVGVEGELGWCLHPAHWGHGYAEEAVRAVIGVAFGPLGLRRVVAHCFAANEASWRLMERLGMRREVHTVRESLHRSGAWLDGLSYALLAEEWPRR